MHIIYYVRHLPHNINDIKWAWLKLYLIAGNFGKVYGSVGNSILR